MAFDLRAMNSRSRPVDFPPCVDEALKFKISSKIRAEFHNLHDLPCRLLVRSRLPVVGTDTMVIPAGQARLPGTKFAIAVAGHTRLSQAGVGALCHTGQRHAE